MTDGEALYGTGQPVTPPRLLCAGKLTAELEAGNLRYIRFDGAEMIRGIAWLARGPVWNTLAPEIAALTVRETATEFRVSYSGAVRDGAATLSYDAEIVGTADGALAFTVTAVPDSDFVTCRAGFVVLHPIADVAGQPVEVEHVDGQIVPRAFPNLIDPVQPMRDLRALTHVFAPGARVTCRMTGDTFEMEDQRNWTDASYKTYVRPLALPWPYTLPAGEPVTQAVSLAVRGAPKSVDDAGAIVTIEIGRRLGLMPSIAIGCDPEEAAAALPYAARLGEANIAALVCRFDARRGHDAAALRPVRELAAQIGAAIDLQLVVASPDAWEQDIAAAAAHVRAAGLTLASVAVSPAADLKSTPPGSIWPPCPPAEAVLAATRAAFPGVPLGGGMLSTFTELNRKRPPLGLVDFVTFCTSANVHAADDRSVMETLESLPAVAASVRDIVRGLPWRVGPSSIGMRANPYGDAPLANPENIRLAMGGRDPRQFAQFNAAWTLGYIARFAAAGATQIALGGPVGDHGIVGPDGACPVFGVIQGSARLRGGTVHATTTSREHDVLALMVVHDRGRELRLANLTAQLISVAIPPPFQAPAATLALDAYAVVTLHAPL